MARFSSIVALIDLGILAIVGLIYWKSDDSTTEQFTEALEIAGILGIGIVFFGIKGNLRDH